MGNISSKDAVFTLHIEGREAVELEGVEIAGFAEANPDKILVDRACMQMARNIGELMKQRELAITTLKTALSCFEDSKDFGDFCDALYMVRDTLKKLEG